MFPVCLSCISVFQVVAHRCRLPYVSFLHEIDGNGALLHGVELDLPPLFPREAPLRFFFWSSTAAECFNPYEDAVLQSLRFLGCPHRGLETGLQTAQQRLYRAQRAPAYDTRR
jgi:hypothetical protein